MSKFLQLPKAGAKNALTVSPSRKSLQIISPDPGHEVMAVIDGMADQLMHPIKADPHLQQMILRYRNMIVEGEGVNASEEYKEIDEYIGQICVDYLRRQKARRASVTANCVLTNVLHIHLSLKVRGVAVRRRMEITL